ncbi:hypothetical protein CDL15_Pgr011050 [Punica granatum]|uniref:Uncharacterized protein n=1 Tax=Punica granatum TaxID=22663 RepID=A0A218XNH0_PUNGR|nr:hypothetical protein CDL15_Pgr011050 [Punica granatum]
MLWGCVLMRELEQRHGSIGLVGEDILAQDALRVQFLPLRPFYRGEIVAWRIQNGEKFRYGRSTETVREGKYSRSSKLLMIEGEEEAQIEAICSRSSTRSVLVFNRLMQAPLQQRLSSRISSFSLQSRIDR